MQIILKTSKLNSNKKLNLTVEFFSIFPHSISKSFQIEPHTRDVNSFPFFKCYEDSFGSDPTSTY